MGKFEAPKKKRKPSKKLAGILVLILTAAAIVAISLLVKGCSGSVKPTDQETMGIDVARYQGTIDWELVSKTDIDFAMIRLGYRTMVDGEIVEDSNARYYMQEASNNGILIGGYFFSTAITPEEAIEEANWVADLVAQYPITYPIAFNSEGFLDEENRHCGLTKEQRTEIARAFMDTIEKRGYEPMFYASKHDMQQDAHWLTSDIQKDYKIWVAHYPDVPYPETQSSDFTGRHQMWQYTALGNVPGIYQNVDLDLAYFGYSKAAKPKDSSKPPEASPDPEALMDFESVHETVTAKEETNLRSLPSQGSESQVMYTLKHGQTADRIGISSNGWSKLRFEDNTYYAVSSYLTTNLHGPAGGSVDGIQTEFEDIPDQEVTAKEVVNLRSIPSTKDPDVRVIAQIKKGDIVIRNGISKNGWSRVVYKDQICYAVSNYLVDPNAPEEEPGDPSEIRTQFEPMDDEVTAKDAVNLRTRPTVTEGESEVKIKLEHGQIVKRTGINEDLGWSRVEYEGEELYCITAYLETIIKN